MPTVRTQPSQLRLLVVGQGCDDIDRAFDDATTETTVESVPTLEDARTRFDDIDCLIVQPTTVADDGSGDRERRTDVIDRLETIRSNAPELPVVVLVNEQTSDLVRTVRSYDWTDVLERDDAFARLAHRVLDLLERHRLAVLSRRSLASLEFTGDAIAIVDSDGDVQFASRSFAIQFGTDRDDLTGTPWRALFTDATVAHLESGALPAVAEGWRWAGSCTGRRQTGATFAARIRLGGLEDGSLVFAVDESAESDEPAE
ncbi:PAS domain-containing protein [Natrinema zhouii]|uniref:PAS domain-containing protein n=1 Tax=Natrinema zhouii TaxID=1710539 RepID=UPI001CF78259|nr:PAS domain-containing protein [Natrinema zhouii]QLK24458.2 PAS domain-containing protein [Natrinema zhouii]